MLSPLVAKLYIYAKPQSQFPYYNAHKYICSLSCCQSQTQDTEVSVFPSDKKDFKTENSSYNIVRVLLSG